MGMITQGEMCQVLGADPEWTLILEGAHTLADVQHICGGLHGLGSTYQSEYHRPT